MEKFFKESRKDIFAHYMIEPNICIFKFIKNISLEQQKRPIALKLILIFCFRDQF